jgi:membrane protein implicated in regulation of membrane protease activity
MFDTLNCFYFTLVGIGVLYAVIILIGGGIHDLGAHIHVPLDFGGHVGTDLSHGEVGVPSLSPITIASFVTAFGAFGIFATQGFSASAGVSVLIAAVGAFIVAIISHFAYFYLLVKPQGSSEVTQSDIMGATAEVTTPIPIGGLGEVAFVARGGRVSYPARSLDRVALPRGTTVTIVEMVGSVVAVRARTTFK